jgi:hypothetical protein
MTAGFAKARAGAPLCLCAPETSAEEMPRQTGALVRIAAAFGFAVLMQALTLAILPQAGRITAPQDWLAGLPFVLLLTGAAAASFPASLLLDLFGRRAAFALGGGLGIAGGLLAAYGFHTLQFGALCLGSFWLGAAQGFGFFYRHLASGIGRASAVGVVLGGGSLAAIAAPSLLHLIERNSGPLAIGMAFLATSFAGVLMLACAIGLDEETAPPLAADRLLASSRARTGLLSLANVGAWFVMTMLMASAPLRLAGCGVGLGGTSGIVSLHLLAMYGPAACLGRFAPRFGLWRVLIIGLLLLAMGLFALYFAASVVSTALALSVGGIGWSLVMLSTTIALGMGRSFSRFSLACHDALLFLAAIAGAMLGPALVTG